MKKNSSKITPEAVYLDRRDFISQSTKVLSLTALASFIPNSTLAAVNSKALNFQKNNAFFATKTDSLTDYDEVTSYNNFYELGTSKTAPKKNAHRLKTAPWSIIVDGEVKKPGKLNIEDIHKIALEERVYRMRCVEAWSMVIPWTGFELNVLLKKFEPTTKAKYVEFTTIHDQKRLPGQQVPVLRWPYTEGLRIDEAMHPLTLISTGLYGKTLLPQNGTPLRLIVPWKYGFKSIKSIVRIRLTEKQPQTAWNVSAPNEYGFYSNVNPKAHHPRWRQSKERRIGELGRRKTLLFNGYQEVASLYKGMDLKKYF